ncbi:hypothetical protein C4K22_3162 [Pseudomonas chlororaphis subsp. aurantiaca]|uniref:hypothetical protein n=1 Tax=Pseudomonas chlororaphis TaxID=587753 RepID=UPI000A64A8E6|nr:hypothetical protein [Pseudomonas chlororaphis]AZD22332.1 hypothetical protein C4K24_3029 [Pseudomonas chlororaphis subsp. aurantiaca]AZD35905.1 hypothetical protein C4K22_3162 [Pseudomonas chlororaphis subsp. aurantiaca]AZD42242.1 hypothetical protein C4K21_3168 [Pseudomonas chlororaphis subsp. aurantiaca]AZD66933.1 hypothetical protein C4K17_3047 [Pseudomonas chlororaphis subsp. aurantiaca]AZD73410.1 hypothetical protein C4K16_3050 [Pseudomonas chlororaphis subsp. aurantiaca]
MSSSSSPSRDRRYSHWKVEHLPATPAAFMRFFASYFKLWYLALHLLQIAAVVCTILVPWGLGQITRTVSNGWTASTPSKCCSGP